MMSIKFVTINSHAAGAAKNIRFTVKCPGHETPAQAVRALLTAAGVAFVNAQSKLVTGPGNFEVMIGNLKAAFHCEP